MKKNEGITLIALIITIIILVILAAVSITAVTQGNIIGWSSDAAAKYIDQSNLENTTLSEFESRWASINSVLSSKLGGGSESNEPPTDLTKLELGQYVAYNPTVLDKDGTKPVAENLLTYTSYQGSGTISGSGYLSEGDDGTDRGQMFTAQSDLKWVILDINESTGAVTLLSEKSVKTDNNEEFYLKGAVGYLYAEEQLHKACSVYGHGFGADTNLMTTYKVGGPFDEETRTLTGTGARSITIEDVNKLAKVGAEKDSEGKVTTTFNELNDRYGDLPPWVSSSQCPAMVNLAGIYDYPDGNDIPFVTTCYSYDSSFFQDVAPFAASTFSGTEFMFASRCVNAHTPEGGPTFGNFTFCGVQQVSSTRQYFYGFIANVSYQTLFVKRGIGTGGSGFIRPVVILKKNAIDTTSEYNGTTGWKLQ